MGFCLPLSFARRSDAPRAGVAAKFLSRGLRLVLASWLLNFLIFRDEPFWEGGVLQTIGLGIILCLPPLLVMHRRGVPAALIAIAVAAYVLFSVSYGQVLAWAPAHPVLGRIFLFEFAPWPWVSLVWIGLALGWAWARLPSQAERARYLAIMSAVGVLFLAAFAAWDWAHGTPLHLSLSFKRDFIVNNHWIARGVTCLLCFGSVFSLLGLAYWLVEVRRLPVGWLVVMGRTSLMIYFIHHVFVYTLVNQWLGWKLHTWLWYWVANAALALLLVGLGWLWLEIQAIAARRRLQTA